MKAWGAKVKTTKVLALVAAAVCMNDAAAQSTKVGVVDYGVLRIGAAGFRYLYACAGTVRD